MVQSDLLASYEHDFKDCVKLLEEIIDDADPASKLDKNSFALENANKLLKQMEVEAMNFMEDDSVRKRVSATTGKFPPFLQRVCWSGNILRTHRSQHLSNTFSFCSDDEIQIRLRQAAEEDQADLAGCRPQEPSRWSVR